MGIIQSLRKLKTLIIMVIIVLLQESSPRVRGRFPEHLDMSFSMLIQVEVIRIYVGDQAYPEVSEMVPSYYGLVHCPQSLDWCIRSLSRGVIFQISPYHPAKEYLIKSNHHRQVQQLISDQKPSGSTQLLNIKHYGMGVQVQQYPIKGLLVVDRNGVLPKINKNKNKTLEAPQLFHQEIKIR